MRTNKFLIVHYNCNVVNGFCFFFVLVLKVEIVHSHKCGTMDDSFTPDLCDEAGPIFACTAAIEQLHQTAVDDEARAEYDAIHGLLINCIKELKEEIKELKNGFTK